MSQEAINKSKSTMNPTDKETTPNNTPTPIEIDPSDPEYAAAFERLMRIKQRVENGAKLAQPIIDPNPPCEEMDTDETDEDLFYHLQRFAEKGDGEYVLLRTVALLFNRQGLYGWTKEEQTLGVAVYEGMKKLITKIEPLYDAMADVYQRSDGNPDATGSAYRAHETPELTNRRVVLVTEARNQPTNNLQ
jgi:hypothetical protein